MRKAKLLTPREIKIVAQVIANNRIDMENTINVAIESERIYQFEKSNQIKAVTSTNDNSKQITTQPKAVDIEEWHKNGKTLCLIP